VADRVKNATANLVIRGLVMLTWATRKDRRPKHSYSESKLDAEP
jgi:hypothetical protein